MALTPLAGARLRPLGHLSARGAAMIRPRALAGQSGLGREPLGSHALLRFAVIRASVFRLDSVEDLFTVHGDILRRVNAHAHLIALDAKYSDRDFFTDHDGFPDPSGEYQHIYTPQAPLLQTAGSENLTPCEGPAGAQLFRESGRFSANNR